MNRLPVSYEDQRLADVESFLGPEPVHGDIIDAEYHEPRAYRAPRPRPAYREPTMPACAPGQSIRVIHRNTSETVTEIRCDAPTRSRRRDEPWASVVTRVVTGLALVGVGIGAAVLAIAAREDSVGLTLCITLSVVALAGGVWHLREQGG